MTANNCQDGTTRGRLAVSRGDLRSSILSTQQSSPSQPSMAGDGTRSSTGTQDHSALSRRGSGTTLPINSLCSGTTQLSTDDWETTKVPPNSPQRASRSSLEASPKPAELWVPLLRLAAQPHLDQAAKQAASASLSGADSIAHAFVL
ncbi:hypothetical protein ACJZ2D_013315 [Fusarium nematophilum]